MVAPDYRHLHYTVRPVHPSRYLYQTAHLSFPSSGRNCNRRLLVYDNFSDGFRQMVLGTCRPHCGPRDPFGGSPYLMHPQAARFHHCHGTLSLCGSCHPLCRD